MGGTCSSHGEMLNMYRILFRKTVGTMLVYEYLGVDLKTTLKESRFTRHRICGRPDNETEIASRILCDYETLSELIFRRFGKTFVEFSDYYQIPP
jgi:hypothetical protein